MKFTNECKTLLEKILKENEVDCVEIVLTEGENGDIDINLGIVDSKECERVVEIDGVKVAIDEDTHAALIDAIFSADGDELTIGFEEHEGCSCGGRGALARRRCGVGVQSFGIRHRDDGFREPL